MRIAAVIAAVFGVTIAAASSPAAGSFAEDAAKWRANYEASLKAPDGWLSVMGLFWLHEGTNTLGADTHSDIVLTGAPAHAGTLTLRSGKVFRDRDSKPLVTDAADHPDVIRIGDLSLTIIDRIGKLGVRVRDPNAPERRAFTGSNWFPADAHWKIEARWTPYSQPKKIAITNVLGMTDQEAVPGVAEFTVAGKAYRLEPVLEDGELFFMFKDATTAKTTYSAGRFLYAPLAKDGKVTLDFNHAHNPPCVFTAFATCPLPPKQNTLRLAIEAGEKKYGHRE